jgi:hypothetical protein
MATKILHYERSTVQSNWYLNPRIVLSDVVTGSFRKHLCNRFRSAIGSHTPYINSLKYVELTSGNLGVHDVAGNLNTEHVDGRNNAAYFNEGRV